MKKSCMGCDKPNTKFNPIHQIRLCKKCSKHELVSGIEAEYEYFLTKDELDNCRFEYTMDFGNYNKHTISYNFEDVVTCFCKKYSVEYSEVKDKQDELTDNKDELQARQERKRKRKLKKALEGYDLELRLDSKLCRKYINGTIKDKTVDEIAERMCQMKYLYDYCHMDSCYEKAVKDQKKIWKAGYIPDVPLIMEAEDIALRKYGKKGKYPKRWPWLNYD